MFKLKLSITHMYWISISIHNFLLSKFQTFSKMKHIFTKEPFWHGIFIFISHIKTVSLWIALFYVIWFVWTIWFLFMSLLCFLIVCWSNFMKIVYMWIEFSSLNVKCNWITERRFNSLRYFNFVKGLNNMWKVYIYTN